MWMPLKNHLEVIDTDPSTHGRDVSFSKNMHKLGGVSNSLFIVENCL